MECGGAVADHALFKAPLMATSVARFLLNPSGSFFVIVWPPQSLVFGIAHSSFQTFPDSCSEIIMEFDPPCGRDSEGREF